MTYEEAVQLALDGEERGFGYLYEQTYKSKLYLALQYMKNESDAEDVLQDAYVRAFTNLSSLKNPEHFSSWLGQIVANTAKNALQKKNPILFADVTPKGEDETFEPEIEDTSIENQPELNYTREETRTMVQELIDSLSDEQRVSILMYYMDDLSIKEIAEALNCSENTVKSRLNYGRKNLKAKADDMQKKGYKLYSFAPLLLLLLLLHNDAQAAEISPAFVAMGRGISDQVFPKIQALTHGTPPKGPGTAKGAPNPKPKAPAPGGVSAVQKGAGSAIRIWINTAAGRIVITIVIVVVIGGGIFGINRLIRGRNPEVEVPTAEEPAPTGSEDAAQGDDHLSFELPEEGEDSSDSKQSTETKNVSDDQYGDLLEGGMTKSQFEELLGYAPVGMTDGQVSKKEVAWILEDLAFDSFFRFSDSPEKLIGVEGTYENQYSDEYGDIDGYFEFNLSEMNNYLSVLLAEPLTSENLYTGRDDAYNPHISGNTLSVVKEAGDYGLSQKATITDAVQSGDTMTINFSVELYDSVNTTYEDRYAILKQTDSGRYRIDSVSKGSADLSAMTSQADTTGSLADLYAEVLKDVQADKYEFEVQAEDFIVDTAVIYGYKYFLTDMNGNGTLDLVVAKVYNSNTGIGTGVFDWYDTRAFYAEQKEDTWNINIASGEIELISAYTSSGHNGFLATVDYGRGTGEGDYRWMTVASGALARGEDLSQPQGNVVDWFDASDLSGLSSLD